MAVARAGDFSNKRGIMSGSTPKKHPQPDGEHGKFLVADMESSVTAVRMVAGFLAGTKTPVMSGVPSSKVAADVVSVLPQRLQKKAFELAGRSAALRHKRVNDIDVDDIDQWVVDEYSAERTGRQTYPAVMIGAVSGAAFFLASALGIPFLPQTTLVAVKDADPAPDEPKHAMHRWAPAAREIAENNPRISVYHMHDPAQDRPMMEKTAFFRLKRAGLGPVYQEFLQHHLAPGGHIITLENTRTWRVTQTGERSFFQLGCLGGLLEEEYFTGSQRLSDFLQTEGSARRHWDAPAATGRLPDGEWGFDPALAEELDDVARRNGWQRRRLYQNEPQDASAFIAELFRDWYRRLGWEDNRLLAQTYTMLDAETTIATGSVPFWNRFHMQPSFNVLSEYLESTQEYAEILVSLFSNGVRSPGLVELSQWEELATRHASTRGGVIGVNPKTYPLDAGHPLRYRQALESVGPHRDLPESLTVADIDAFAHTYGIARDGDGLPEHRDDVTGEGIRNPVSWVGG
jgi:hypothetical protein